MSRTYTIVENARHGRFLVNPNDTYIGRALITYGEWSEAEARLFAKLLRPGDTVVEAGANIGSLTVPLSRIVGQAGSVIAFEPQRLVFQLLCANAALNDCWNVDTRQAAVGADSAHVSVDRIAPNSAKNFGSIQVNSNYSDSMGIDRVPMVSIDSLGLERLDFIKADVEGYEQAVIEGANETIARCRPAIFFEHNDLDNWHVPELLWSMGYDCYLYATQLWDAQNHFRCPADIWSPPNVTQCSVDVLALPHGGRWRIGGLHPISRSNPLSPSALPIDADNYVEMPIVERS